MPKTAKKERPRDGRASKDFMRLVQEPRADSVAARCSPLPEDLRVAVVVGYVSSIDTTSCAPAIFRTSRAGLRAQFRAQ
jgi:hypothetical protein